jgi:hypothetical protein
MTIKNKQMEYKGTESLFYYHAIPVDVFHRDLQVKERIHVRVRRRSWHATKMYISFCLWRA